MSTARFPLTLRRLLLIDAITCLAMGIALLFANAPLAALTGFSPTLLMVAGLVLLACAAFMGLLARWTSPPTAGVRLVIGGNLLWVVASVLLPLLPEVDPTPAGLAGLFAQAAGVAALAALEQFALGRANVPASAH